MHKLTGVTKRYCKGRRVRGPLGYVPAGCCIMPVKSLS
jgi:hypothetical protein